MLKIKSRRLTSPLNKIYENLTRDQKLGLIATVTLIAASDNTKKDKKLLFIEYLSKSFEIQSTEFFTRKKEVGTTQLIRCLTDISDVQKAGLALICRIMVNVAGDVTVKEKEFLATIFKFLEFDFDNFLSFSKEEELELFTDYYFSIVFPNSADVTEAIQIVAHIFKLDPNSQIAQDVFSEASAFHYMKLHQGVYFLEQHLFEIFPELKEKAKIDDIQVLYEYLNRRVIKRLLEFLEAKV